MDILRLTVISLLTASLLVGCDKKPTTTVPAAPAQNTTIAQLTATATQGQQKDYWIQSYSVITKDNKIDWSSKNTIGTELLVNYNVAEAKDNLLNFKVVTKHSELKIKGFAAYPSPILQTILTKGMQYQFNINSDKPLTITQDDSKLQQQIDKSVDLNSEYHYLQFVIAPPLLPTNIPLAKDQTVTVKQFMGMNELTVKVDDITDQQINVTLQSTDQPGQLYGKAVINKNTGWIEKMALVKEAPVTGRTDYNMRTVLLMGPSDWSNDDQRQLITEMHIKEAKQYTQPFPIFGFNKDNWQQNQQKEITTTSTEGKLFTLNTPDGANQLMLMYKNNTGTSANALGQYQIEDLQVNGKQATMLAPAPNMEIDNLSAGIKEINVATYKPIHANPTKPPIKSTAIKTASAEVSFFPYQLETLLLPVSKKTATIANKQGDFSINITPSNQNNVYILTWRAKDNVSFGAGLINGADNALVQYIQPDTIAWLTPSESRIINSLDNGYENRLQITFTNEPPIALELYLLKHGDKAAYSHSVTFKRNP